MTKKQSFLMKFKTLAILAVLFITLGSCLLPEYHTVHYRLGDDISDFPVLTHSHGMPFVETIQKLSESSTLQTEAIDLEENMAQQRISFTPVDKNGSMHYELKAVSPLYTVVASYYIVDNKPQPISQRTTGLLVWTQAFFVTLILAVLILVVQVVLGLVKSASLSPQQKKRLRSQQKKR
ncbi:MAG: hypothetical protein Q4B82_04100 [Alysiella sp.]|uniref:hypothetical protein n=1 Tax=Alysiella sp. TaxID=1872483 RepID=UPI0026DB0DB5|nr:hypothetical protein [Alysiella sp.]MDO4433743.1 hypothetical protein [Alysiella sp.]